MPVTAKLSRKFYDRLGDDVANELVEWFNAVDSDYKSDLREVNELNWNRFRADLDARSTHIDAKFASVDAKFASVDAKFASVDVRFGALEARIDLKAAELRAELLKWMFLFWVGTLVPLGGLMVALTQGLR